MTYLKTAILASAVMASAFLIAAQLNAGAPTSTGAVAIVSVGQVAGTAFVARADGMVRFCVAAAGPAKKDQKPGANMTVNCSKWK